MIPFVRELDVAYGRVDRVSPLIRRVIAENPGPFTFTGTGTYIVGGEAVGAGVAVIDPGPPDEAHLRALLAAVAGQRVTHVLVTHTHRDHSPLARPFAEAVGAPVLAARPPVQVVHASGALDEDEDDAFSPDVILAGGEVLDGDGWTIEAMATPGHASNHMAFVLREENALFSGDHVMGWSTTVVAPPDGDMTAYLASLDAVIGRRFSTLWPTHGAPVTEPQPFLKAYRAHRLEREAQILAQLEGGPCRIREMVPALYAAVDPRLWPAAGLSVWAHLIALERAAKVSARPRPGIDAVWRLAGSLA
ncbi:glyoxylase-like metal-dependent hydrolase (beta-lactamase superfamily II) [Brevundimonas alba]|uniref:Glyoxylase-like metal-dependent hydrolase (Beta-lactamase superfamily II) n=1 Tax=Brevundimonas alba TaxID=74314 RepID=A0A7X6BNV6_9CAUL|nr:MBL fold metallo-hydrolase [Brevundimonas alba]NJC42578.1 glyoxylase-like metal-dependent hydrolase (beta-lactamase superfamily II) [Brevundimonas alba]